MLKQMWWKAIGSADELARIGIQVYPGQVCLDAEGINPKARLMSFLLWLTGKDSGPRQTNNGLSQKVLQVSLPLKSLILGLQFHQTQPRKHTNAGRICLRLRGRSSQRHIRALTGMQHLLCCRLYSGGLGQLYNGLVDCWHIVVSDWSPTPGPMRIQMRPLRSCFWLG